MKPVDKRIKKILIRKQVFNQNSVSPITWKDVKVFDFQDEDELHFGHDNGNIEGDDQWNPFYYATIFRMIEETDSEFKERIKWDQELRDRNLNARRKMYIKLKKEFEKDGRK